ncbi:MAG: hypothetical protein ACXVCM_04455, partial [Ktedonobacteraceae bacterium]
MTFGPWHAAPVPGPPTAVLSSGAVSHRAQRKVPGSIIVEGITATPKGGLPDEGFCAIERRYTAHANHPTARAPLA